MTPSFTDLTYFHEAAATLNLSHAAQKLHVSQPSLSIAINRLETTLKTTLFIRHRQGVTLTQAGERLYDHVGTLLQQWQKTQSSLQDLNNQVSGRVSIGCHATLAPHISQISAKLLATHSLLSLQIKHDISVRLTEQVITGTLDIGIVYDPIEHPDLIMHRIDEFEMTFWESKDHRSNHEIVISDPEIKQMQHLLSAYQKANTVSRVCPVNNYETIAHLTACGAGVGILPRCIVTKHYTATLQQLTGSPSLYSQLFLIYRGENRNFHTREVVIHALKAYIAESK